MALPVTIFFDGLSYAAWLFLISIGLTLVFGVLRILNIAHGGFYSFGAYSGAYAIGLCASHGFGAGWQALSAIVLAMAAGATLGVTVERLVVGRLYREPQALILFATYAVSLILDDLTKMIWGGQSLYADGPRNALGQVTLGQLQYPVYDVLLVVLSAILALVTWTILNATRVGRCVTAVVFDREMSAAMGVDVNRVMTGTFVVGAALGALAGALTAPKVAVSPGIGAEVIVLAFAVVVIGGLGSVRGAVAGALIAGMARALAVHLLPSLAVFAVFAAMLAVLAVKPHGLFARAEARRI